MTIDNFRAQLRAHIRKINAPIAPGPLIDGLHPASFLAREQGVPFECHRDASDKLRCNGLTITQEELCALVST